MRVAGRCISRRWRCVRRQSSRQPPPLRHGLIEVSGVISTGTTSGIASGITKGASTAIATIAM
jgi:hypothetical protein